MYKLCYKSCHNPSSIYSILFSSLPKLYKENLVFMLAAQNSLILDFTFYLNSTFCQYSARHHFSDVQPLFSFKFSFFIFSVQQKYRAAVFAKNFGQKVIKYLSLSLKINNLEIRLPLHPILFDLHESVSAITE